MIRADATAMISESTMRFTYLMLAPPQESVEKRPLAASKEGLFNKPLAASDFSWRR